MDNSYVGTILAHFDDILRTTDSSRRLQTTQTPIHQKITRHPSV